jgi:hypothetical protein
VGRVQTNPIVRGSPRNHRLLKIDRRAAPNLPEIYLKFVTLLSGSTVFAAIFHRPPVPRRNKGKYAAPAPEVYIPETRDPGGNGRSWRGSPALWLLMPRGWANQVADRRPSLRGVKGRETVA